MKMSHKIVAVTLSVAVMGSILYMSSSNESEYTEIINKVAINNRKQKDLQAEKKVDLIQDAPPGGSGSSNTSTTQVKGDGKLITDITANKGGAPLYDGLTRNDPRSELDYELLRSSNQDNPLKYLGDYTTKEGEIITTEYSKYTSVEQWVAANGSRYGAKGAMKANRDMLSKTTNGKYWMINGRLAVCMTGMVIMTDEDRKKVEPLCMDESKYTYPGSRSGITGKCFEPDRAIAPSWVDAGEGSKNFNFDIDIVLDNGNVLAATIVEYKGIQIGKDSGALYDCTKVKGYCHYQGKLDGTKWNVCSLELQTVGITPGTKEAAEDLGLYGRKIVKIIVYQGSIKWK